MARAEAASASIRSDSIKGLAQSIAKPAYHRLLSAEPLLRRAVPVLIIAFLDHHLRRRRRAGARTAPPGGDGRSGRPSRRSPTRSRPSSTGRAAIAAPMLGRTSDDDRTRAADLGGAAAAAPSSSPTPTAPSSPACRTRRDRSAGTSSTCSDPTAAPDHLRRRRRTPARSRCPTAPPPFATVRALQNPLGHLAVVETEGRRAGELALRRPR